MSITSRQKQILEQVIEEYTMSAQPVSSLLLQQKRGFELCPATIRNEMQKLTEQGYLKQPHTSSGRVPTDKAYRLFVDNLKDPEFDKEFLNEFQEIIGESKDVFKIAQLLVKSISSSCLDLTISYLPQNDLLFKEGWEEVFQKPEFRDTDYSLRFLQLVKQLEKDIESFEINKNEPCSVYIGSENPVVKLDDFSIIVSKCAFPEDEQSILMVLGPKRMAYERNISLINSVNKLLESL